jgi:hypothetical protein
LTSTQNTHKTQPSDAEKSSACALLAQIVQHDLELQRIVAVWEKLTPRDRAMMVEMVKRFAGATTAARE